MLSRIAESLYWIGRYVERAEDTARILDVHVHHLIEDPWVDEPAACASLLAVMGLPQVSGELDVRRATDLLAFDDENQSSIVGSIAAARENARGAREAISSELWEAINATWNGLPDQSRAVAAFGPHQFLAWVKERAAMIAGLADSTINRDDGWLFLVLGRSLERVDMTARLLSDRFSEAGTSPEWVMTLRSCSAHEAFLRTYRRGVTARLAAEFLLVDRLFPRSVFHALSEAERCLAELDPHQGRSGLGDDARRLVGRARTSLEFRPIGEVLTDLQGTLSRLQEVCASTNAAIADRYFHQTAPVSWSA